MLQNLKFQISKVLRFLVIVLTFNICVLSLPSPVHAQSSTPSSTLQLQNPASSFQLPSSIPPTSPIYTDLLVHNLFHTFSCLSIGSSIIGQPCLTYQITQNAQGAIQGVPILSSANLSGGLLGATTGLIAGLYMNPPVRTIDYLASVGEGLGIVKPAHAQVVGSGAQVLSPILKLWQVSRNISYVIMIIIFVIIGFMVMFRQRINPQTVITAQAALPGLVIGLILITFSYFFAALLTDTAFLGVNVVGHYFSAAQTGSPPKLAQDIAGDNVGTIFSKFVGMLSVGDISGALGSVFNSLDGGVQFWIRLLAGVIGFQTGASIGGPIGSLGGAGICAAVAGTLTAPAGGIGAAIAPFCGMLTGLAGQVIGGSVLGIPAFANPTFTFSLVIYFVAIAVLIYAMFKLLLRLINSFLSIIFLTVTAPFQFLAAALPGRQGVATNWILNMLANVLAFPAVFAVFYFVAYLWGTNTAPGQLFGITASPGVAGPQTLPLFGGLDLNFIRILLAYGALLATPAIPDIINRTIGRMGQAGQLIGQEISGSTRAGQGYAGRLGAAPGQTGRALGPLGQSLGDTYEIIPAPNDPLGYYVYRKPGIAGALRRQQPVRIR
ncbi:MAG: hypothetical protein AAB414_00720 [Patescibacteria group bacterium]